MTRFPRLARAVAATAATLIIVVGDVTASPLPVATTPIVDSPFQVRDRIPEGTVIQIDVDPTPGVPVTIAIEIDGEPMTLDLLPHSVRSPDYQVLAQVESGELVPLEPGPIRTLRGVVVERPGSFVAASLVDHGIEAMIDLPEVDGRHWIQPVPDEGPGAHMVYHDEQVLGSGATCGFDEKEHGAGGVDLPPNGPNGAGTGGVAGGDCYWFADLAIDADYEFYQVWGSSTSTVENLINSIINAINDQYEQDVGVSHQISTLIIRTTPNDPYSSTSSAGGLLNEFRGYWNNNNGGIVRDVAHLFTGRDFAGDTIGVAFAANICTSSAYGVVQQISVFSCRTDLSAHELGHNWGVSGHCSCPSYTMNASLTCANRFNSAYSIPLITNYRNTRTFCLDNECIPSNDDCQNAFDVTDGSYAFTTVNASTDGFNETLCDVNGENGIDNDVWYRYTAECDGEVTVGACNSNFDSRIAIYESFCPSTVNQAIACNDDFCGSRAQVTFEASSGTDYLIRLGGSNENTGQGFLSIEGPFCIPEPTNNDCGSATTIQEGMTAFNSFGATTDGPSEDSCSQPIENDVWFRFLAPCDGTATLSLCDSSFDTVMAVYGAVCPSADNTALACNDDACGTQSAVSLEVNAGSLYRVRVGGVGGAAGSGVLSLSCGDIVDCNGNGVPDDQDIADGDAEDCNGNDVPDSCDIEDGTSDDANGNGVPDECDPEPCPTDIDGNGATDVDDLVAVILEWGGDDPNVDVDGSGTIDVDDLVAVILAWGPCP